MRRIAALIMRFGSIELLIEFVDSAAADTDEQVVELAIRMGSLDQLREALRG
jgi:hypothetical protein